MTPDKERRTESIKLLREFLVKFHEDKDDDSLFVRFGELLTYISEKEFEVGSHKRMIDYIGSLKN